MGSVKFKKFFKHGVAEFAECHGEKRFKNILLSVLSLCAPRLRELVRELTTNFQTVKNTLAALSVKAPHTGKPFTEEMLLGIGGGLGMGYILWEFKKHDSAILAMAFQNKWN